MRSEITDIEHLSKTREHFDNELSYSGKGLKLNKKSDCIELVELINKHANLKVLRLDGNTISPEAAQEIGECLSKQPELERFIGNDLFTGRLKDEIPLALKSICGGFQRAGAHLVELNFSDNAFGPIGLDALVSFLESEPCFTLREFRMHNNGLGPEGARKFANALAKCHEKSQGKLSLRVFVCGRNRLELEGCRAVSNTLKQIGTLEEIQMPQNGIRPNGIEFIADACASNPNLRIINLNDNTFRKIGGEQMGKALCKLSKLEYVNFGDCLLGSQGARQIALALASSPQLKELILSFNEIKAWAGLEIAQTMIKKANTLTMLDLNGNKFGEEGKLEIQQILESMRDKLVSLSEDEGSEDEEDAEDEDEYEQEEESDDEDEEDEEDEEEDYDQVDDYDEYEDYDDEVEEVVEEKVGSLKIGGHQAGQPHNVPQLFKDFKPADATFKPSSNLFSNLIQNDRLLTRVEEFDAFIIQASIDKLDKLTPSTYEQVAKHEKYDGSFIVHYLAHLSKLFDKQNTENHQKLVDSFKNLIAPFVKESNGMKMLADSFLAELGFLKKEDKKLKPIMFTEQVAAFLKELVRKRAIPAPVVATVRQFLLLRASASGTNFNAEFKERSAAVLAALSA